MVRESSLPPFICASRLGALALLGRWRSSQRGRRNGLGSECPARSLDDCGRHGVAKTLAYLRISRPAQKFATPIGTQPKLAIHIHFISKNENILPSRRLVDTASTGNVKSVGIAGSYGHVWRRSARSRACHLEREIRFKARAAFVQLERGEHVRDALKPCSSFQRRITDRDGVSFHAQADCTFHHGSPALCRLGCHVP
jgi:hypothetical protein